MGSNLDMSPPVHRMSPDGQTRAASRRQTRASALGKLPLALFILTLFAGGSPRISHAQFETASVLSYLDRTDRAIERALDQLGASAASRTVSSLLNKAMQIQREAWDAYRAGNSKMALVKTRDALDLARRALEAAEIDSRARESIRDLIESTKEQIDRASPILAERGDPQARRLLDTGVWQLQRAEDAYRDGEYKKAIRLAVSARDLVQRALEGVRAGSVGDAPRPIEDAINRTDALIDELRAAVGAETIPAVRALLDESVSLQRRAKTFQESRRPGMALRLTAQARQAALDGLLTLARNPSPGDVERAIAIVEQLANDLTPEILSSDSNDAHVLLESAQQRQGDAKEALSKGDVAGAMESARIAEKLLRRAAEAAGIR